MFTFLFTDIAGSTRLWQEYADDMPGALALHDSLIRQSVVDAGGTIFKHTGDGVAAVFNAPGRAVACAVAAQIALAGAEWPATGQLHVRMGVHSGVAIARDGDYFGTAVNKAARLMGVGHGDQILVSGATASIAANADSWHLIDLGPHRLRDLAGAVEVKQVAASGLNKDFPPLRTLEAYRSNLPHNLPSYVGREDLVREIEAEMMMSPLITLAGIGGIGKTRLAQQIGAQVLPYYKDGAWFVDLSSVRDEEDFCPSLARVLDVKEQSTEPLATTLSVELRNKQLLLILDNCEQATNVVGEFVETIVHAAPDVRVLATSREQLGVQGERLWRLSGLDDDSALALFIQRATDAGGHVDIVKDRETIIDLCHHIDGLPLAIELAAARSRTMSPAQILDKVGQRFRLLKANDRRSERHQTLRAMIDWSYDMLTGEQKTVLNRLAVFEGQFDLGSVEQVITDETLDEFTVIDTVDELVGKSLVNVDQTDDMARFSLMETVREYAIDLLDETGELGDLVERHTAYFTSRARTLGSRLTGTDVEAAANEFGFEIANIDAVLDRLRDSGRFDEMAQVASSLSTYWPLMSPGSGRLRYEELAAAADQMDEDVALGTLIAAVAFFAEQAYVPQANALLDQARSLANTNDIEIPAFLYYAAAGVAEIDGKPQEVLTLAKQGLALTDDDPFTRIALRLRMLTSVVKSDPEHAVEHALQTVSEANEFGLDMFVAAGHFLVGTAHVLIAEHDDDVGIEALDRAIALAGTTIPQVTIGALVLKAVALRHRRPDEAIALAQQAIEVESAHLVMPAFRVIAADLVALARADGSQGSDAARILGSGAGLRERLGFAGLWWATDLHEEACSAVSQSVADFESLYEDGKGLAAAEVRRLVSKERSLV